MYKFGLNSKKKILVVIMVGAVLLAYVVCTLFYWQFVRGEELQAKAIDQQTRESNINSNRGVIYDRNGKILAQNTSV